MKEMVKRPERINWEQIEIHGYLPVLQKIGKKGRTELTVDELRKMEQMEKDPALKAVRDYAFELQSKYFERGETYRKMVREMGTKTPNIITNDMIALGWKKTRRNVYFKEEIKRILTLKKLPLTKKNIKNVRVWDFTQAGAIKPTNLARGKKQLIKRLRGKR
ncbi:MAG: hypothetical protein V1911_01675 [Candidatus Micrarchaeota archaeon]